MSTWRRIGAAMVGLASCGASGQTFAEYFLDGVNLTDGGRGMSNIQPGDVVRLSLRVAHDGHSYGGGRVEVLYGGAFDGSITISEPNEFVNPPDILDWADLGRHPYTRIVTSDGPADATQPHNVDVVASGGKVTDINDDFFDFASTPPGLGGLTGPFPITSGDSIFNFDYVFGGGLDKWSTRNVGTARLWRSRVDVLGVEVPATDGDIFWVGIPAPHGVGVLALTGMLLRRRVGGR